MLGAVSTVAQLRLRARARPRWPSLHEETQHRGQKGSIFGIPTAGSFAFGEAAALSSSAGWGRHDERGEQDVAGDVDGGDDDLVGLFQHSLHRVSSLRIRRDGVRAAQRVDLLLQTLAPRSGSSSVKPLVQLIHS